MTVSRTYMTAIVVVASSADKLPSGPDLLRGIEDGLPEPWFDPEDGDEFYIRRMVTDDGWPNLLDDQKAMYVLTVNHKYGAHRNFFFTKDAARHDLHDWVASAWDEDDMGGPLPDDKEEAITAYFHWQTEHNECEESYEIDEVTV